MKKNIFLALLVVHFFIKSEIDQKQAEYSGKVMYDSMVCQRDILDITKVISVTEANYQEVVLNSKKPVVVLASAGWCFPCHIFKPIYTKIAQEYSDVFDFVDIDANAFPKFSCEHQINVIPTFLIFMDGKVIERKSHLMTKNDFIAMILDAYNKNL